MWVKHNFSFWAFSASIRSELTGRWRWDSPCRLRSSAQWPKIAQRGRHRYPKKEACRKRDRPFVARARLMEGSQNEWGDRDSSHLSKSLPNERPSRFLPLSDRSLKLARRWVTSTRPTLSWCFAGDTVYYGKRCRRSMLLEGWRPVFLTAAKPQTIRRLRVAFVLRMTYALWPVMRKSLAAQWLGWSVAVKQNSKSSSRLSPFWRLWSPFSSFWRWGTFFTTYGDHTPHLPPAFFTPALYFANERGNFLKKEISRPVCKNSVYRNDLAEFLTITSLPRKWHQETWNALRPFSI